MSMLLMVKAMRTKVGNPLRKLVLIKLADNANDNGECWPSYQHIADQCEIARSTVKVHIRALEEAGLLRREFRRKGEVNQSNVFHLTIGGGAADNPPGAADNLGGGAADNPRTSHSFESINEPFCDQQAGSPKVKQIPFKEIFDAYARCLPKLPQLRIIDESRKAMIRSRWNADERFQTVDFWVRFFTHVSESDFLMGRTDRPWNGCCFDWLLKPANFRKVVEGNYTNA